MNLKALLITLLTVCGWLVTVSSFALTIVIILLGVHISPAELGFLAVTIILLLILLISFQYVGELNTLELKKLKAIQKLEGTVVLKRGPRGRFLKPEVK